MEDLKTKGVGLHNSGDELTELWDERLAVARGDPEATKELERRLHEKLPRDRKIGGQAARNSVKISLINSDQPELF